MRHSKPEPDYISNEINNSHVDDFRTPQDARTLESQLLFENRAVGLNLGGIYLLP